MWHPLIHGGLPYNKLFIFKPNWIRNKQFKGTEIITMKTWPLKPYIKIYFTSLWKGKVLYGYMFRYFRSNLLVCWILFFILINLANKKFWILHTIIILFHVSIWRFSLFFHFLVQSSASSKSSGNTTWLQMWKIPWVYYFFFIL